jgi:hypothetical protein
MPRLSSAALAALLLCACSSPYLKNRGRDGLDIVTLELETHSYGAALRAGPVKAGLNYHSAKGASIGLRGGDPGKHNSEEITIFFAGRDIFRKSAPASPDEAVKTEDAGVENAEAGQAETPAASTSESTELLGARGKELAAFSPFGTVLPAYKKRSLFRSTSGLAPAYYYTQIELSVGLFGGLRIGLNPGELIDALAGIFTFDPFSDDEPFLTAEQRALEENPVYRDLSDEQKRLFREQLSKQAP